jgi:hypothetical protein
LVRPTKYDCGVGRRVGEAYRFKDPVVRCRVWRLCEKRENRAHLTLVAGLYKYDLVHRCLHMNCIRCHYFAAHIRSGDIDLEVARLVEPEMFHRKEWWRSTHTRRTMSNCERERVCVCVCDDGHNSRVVCTDRGEIEDWLFKREDLFRRPVTKIPGKIDLARIWVTHRPCEQIALVHLETF